MATQESQSDVLESTISNKVPYNEASSDVESFSGLVAAESHNAIKYRTCSWQKVSASFGF